MSPGTEVNTPGGVLSLSLLIIRLYIITGLVFIAEVFLQENVLVTRALTQFSLHSFLNGLHFLEQFFKLVFISINFCLLDFSPPLLDVGQLLLSLLYSLQCFLGFKPFLVVFLLSTSSGKPVIIFIQKLFTEQTF